MKNYVSVFLIVLFSVCSISAQEIITADRYLRSVGENYAGIADYEAKIAILSGTTNMHGTISFRSPSLLRIDFIDPADQVIAFNGDVLTVYLPGSSATLSQTVSGSSAGGANLATPQGLILLTRNYNAAYVTGPDPEPIDAGSDEMVIKLRLTRRSVNEGFREIILSVNPETKLLRRIEGQTASNSTVKMDFTEIMINQGIPEQRFVYDSPSSANMYYNFLFNKSE
ncbi:MAG: outer membrane lipoprotein carrier protein LolA [Treponema sp.]|nr:outer membrane lipoprotein carrier protein LolA [Treponema sp.]